MKVLYLYRYAILGGVSTQLANRLRYLRKFCEPHFGFLRDYGGRVAFGDYPYTCILKDNNSIISYINKVRFDVIIVIDTNEVYDAIAKSNFKGLLINEVHTTTSNLNTLSELRKSTPMDALITPSRYLQERIYNEFNFLGVRPVYVVENCLDTELFKYRKLGIKSEKKIILWIGKLDDHKNWKLFLLISHSIKQKRRDCEFWMVGGYTAPDKVVYDMLNEVNRLGLFSDFRWIPRVEYKDMPTLYSMTAKSGGVYISTSQNESFGMTVAESLACRCPVVAPKVGAIPEILDGELSYCLYESNNVRQAVNKVISLIEDKKRRRNILKVGEKRINDKYNIEMIGSKYLDIIRNLNKKSV